MIKKINTRHRGTRGRILEAAASLFAERGFEGTRVEEIASRACVNKASLYYHVGGKATLYEAILAEWVAQVLQEVRRETLPGMSPEERLAAIPRVLQRLIQAYPHYPRIMIREVAAGARRLTPPVTHLMAQLLELEARIIREGVARGCFRDVPVLSVHILLVVGTVVHFAALPTFEEKLGSAIPDMPRAPASPSQAVTDLLLHGILVPSRLGAPAGAPEREATP
jgi:AcrR family transcriptional regulator